MLDGYYEKSTVYSSSESRELHIFCGVEVRELHRFHGIGDMAECIDADVAKRLGIRHSTDVEEIENNDKNAVTGDILRLLSWFMFLRFAFP